MEFNTEKYQLLVENISELVCEVDEGGTFTYLNSQYKKVLGYDPEELLGKTAYEIGHPDEREAAAQKFAEMIQSKNAVNVSWRFRHKNGDWHWFECHGSPYEKAPGKTSVVVVSHDITERKEMEERMRTSEARFQMIADVAGEWIWEVDPEGLYTYASPVVEKILGYKPEDLVHKKHFYDLFVPEERQVLKTAALEAMSRRLPIHGFINKNLDKAGWVVILETNGVPKLDFQGKLLGYCGADTDVTNRQITEERLLQNQERLDMALHSAKMGVWILDFIRHKADVDDQACRLLGVAPDKFEATEKSFFAAVHPDDSKLIRDAMALAIKEDSGFGVEYRVVWPDGSIHFVSSRGSLTKNGAGEPIKVNGIIWDITEHKLAQQKVEESEKKYRAMVETTDTGFVIVDENGIILDANPEYVRMAGHKKLDEIIGHAIVEWTAPYDQEKNTEAIKKCLSQGYIRNYEVDHIDRDGKIIPVEINSNVIETSQGKQIFSLCRDIHERKQTEKILQNSQKNFATIFRSSPIGTSLTRLSTGQFYDVNDSFLNLLGYGYDEVIGSDPQVLNMWVSPNDRTTMVSLLKEQGKTTGFETVFRTKNGRLRNVWVIAELVELDNEFYILGQTLDITIQKSAQEALRLSEERFSKTFRLSPVGIVISQLEDGVIVEANKSYQKMFGYSHSEIIGHTGTELGMYVNPADRDGLKNEFIQKNGLHNYETSMKHRSGKLINVLVSTENIIIDDKKCFLIMCTDITERKETEKKIIQSEKDLKKAQEIAHLGSWKWHIPSNQMEWSDEMFQLYGIDQAAFSGSLTEFMAQAIHPDDRALVEAVSHSIIKNKKTYPFEFRIIWPDRSVHSLWCENGELVLGDNGEPLLLNGITLDITERRQAEQRVRQESELLEICHFAANTRDLMQKLIVFFKRYTGCEAIGVRLHKGDDFPYYETSGFSGKFVKAENSLCSVDASGQIQRAPDGNPILECMCGNILCGRFDPQKTFFTEFGSFWSNSTTELLATTSETDRQAHTRNRCNGEGYESVALIPLRSQGKTYGLIQFNDKRRDRFTAEGMRHLERLVDYLALALANLEAVDALQQSEERFHSIINNSEAGYFFIDRKGIIQDVNPAWVKLYKYSSVEEICGHYYAEIERLEDLESAKEFIGGILANDSRYLKGEFSRKCKDGSIGFHTFSARPVSRNGEVVGIEGFIIDSTERKLAEEALLESEKKYRSLFETMTEGVALHQLIYDENGNPKDYVIEEINPAFELQTGIRIKEARGKLASELYGTHPAPYLDIYYRVVKNGGHEHFQTYFPPMQRYFEINVFSPRSGWFATIFEDITDRKKSEETLLRYRLLEENINDIILFVRFKDGHILEANQAALDAYGYNREELLTLSIDDLCTPGSLSGLIPMMDLKYSKGIHFETTHRRKNGEDFPVEISSQGTTLNEEIIQIEIIRDITDRKLTEDALAKSEHRYESLFRDSPIPMLEVDLSYFQTFLDRNTIPGGDEFTFENYIKGHPEEIQSISDLIKVIDINQAGLAFFNHESKADFVVHMPDWIDAFKEIKVHAEFIALLEGMQNGFEKEFRLQIPDLEEDRWIKFILAIDPEYPIPMAHVLVSLIDLTARKHAENVLRQAEQRFRALFETMSQGVVYYDDEGYVIQANPAAKKILGLTTEELLGRTIDDPRWQRVDLTGAPLPSDLMPSIQSVRSGKEIHHMVFGIFNPVVKDYRWLDESAVPQIRSGEKIPYQTYVIFEDITERLRVEKEKEKLLDQTRQQTDRLSAIIQISSSLRQAQVEEEVLQVLVEQSLRGLNAETILLGLIDGNELVITKAIGLWSGMIGIKIEIDEDFYQFLLNEKPIPFDPKKDSKRSKLSKLFPNTYKSISAALLIPFKVIDAPIGFLVAGFKHSQETSEDKLNLATTIGEIAGNTLQRMRLMGRLEKLASDRAKDLGALYNVISAASGSLNIEEVLKHVLEQVLLIVNSKEGAILLVNEATQKFNVMSSIGLDDIIDLFQTTLMKETVEGWVVKHAEPLLIPDIHVDPKFTIITEKMRQDHYSFLGLPMRTHGRVTGVLITLRKDEPFNLEEMTLIGSIADHVALIMDNLTLYQLYEQAAVSEERSRLARDLHDSATQSLYSVTLYAEATRTMIEKGNIEQSRQYLERMVQTSKMALQEMRLLVYELRPAAIEQDGLVIALRKRLESVENRAGIHTQLEVQNLVQLTPQEEEHLFWISMETLNNSLRHAAATEVTINLKVEMDEIILSIKDNGKGYEPEKGRQSGGMGLQNMQQRAQKINSRLEIISAPGAGVIVNVHLPIKRRLQV